MEVKFSRYDTADYFKTEDDITAYLDAVMEDGDSALIAAALGDIARARNLSQLARDVGMSRQGLDKALFRRWQSEPYNRGESRPSAWPAARFQTDPRRPRTYCPLIAY